MDKNLASLLEYCLAQEVRVEFRLSGVPPGMIELQAAEGDNHWTRQFRSDEFVRDAELVFVTFLDQARTELIRMREA